MNSKNAKISKLDLKTKNIKKDSKEILNNLLKQLLDQKLTKLEKRNITEIKTFQNLTNQADNLIISLESMSKEVLKEICIKRQKYINNNNNNKKSNKNLSKIPKIRPTSPKVIPKTASTKRLSKYKRIDSKSYDKYLQTDINSNNNKSQVIGNKSKPKKLQIKINNNFNKTGLIPHSKSRRTISPFINIQDKDKFNKTMGNKAINVTKRRSSAQKKKSVGSKDIITKTERITKKTAAKFVNKNDNKSEKNNSESNTANNTINTINPLEKLDSNNLDDSRLKVLDVFKQSIKGKDKEGNLNINKEINNNNNKKENKCAFLNTLSKEFGKVGTIKMDEKLVNDSLLVSNNLEGDKTIKIDDLIRGPTFKEIDISTNLEIPNIKADKDKVNNNLIKKNTKKKELNSSIHIYNKLKRSKITFLEGENDFDLIFKDSKIDDMDFYNSKDIDLNLSEAIDQISLEEKFESNLDLIARYLDIKDIFNLMLVNKECFKTIVNFLISKTEISIELLQDEIKRLKEYNSNINFENLKKKPFKLSANSMRAISLLNSSSGNNILKLNIEQLNKKEIILVYSLYFIAIGKKKDILILDDIQKLQYMQNYFKNNCQGQNSFGQLIEKELNGKIFDDKLIFTLYSISKKQLDVISPNYFQKINRDIAIFVFVIKDILEQLGLLGTQFPKPDREYILLNAKLQSNKNILEELNKIEEYIY